MKKDKAVRSSYGKTPDGKGKGKECMYLTGRLTVAL
jgi:hypothetical protein